MKIKRIILTAIMLYWGLLLIGAVIDKPTMVYMIGDSTMSNKKPDKFPETGWGMAFGEFFMPGKVIIDNRAIDECSTKSFIEENRWEPIRATLKKGDYVFMEFGSNDEKVDDPKRGTTPAEYRTNLLKFINDIREKKAIPVLMTPVSRHSFHKTGEYEDTHAAYSGAARELAATEGVAFIYIGIKSEELLKRLGTEASKKLYNWADSGVLKNYPRGVKDNSHFSPEGAREMAQIAR